MKYIFYLLLLCVSFATFSQQSGQVVYKVSLETNTPFDSQLDKKMMEHIRQEEKKVNAILEDYRFVLDFNSIESLYHLEAPMPDETVSSINLFSAKMAGGADGVIYRNLSKKEMINQFDDNGNLVRMIIPYDKVKWKITKETDTILGYRVIKAISEKKEAWFAPGIPVPFGPSQIGNLPGLVLKYKIKIRTVYAVEIKLSNKLKEIKQPIEGELLTEEEVQRRYRANDSTYQK